MRTMKTDPAIGFRRQGSAWRSGSFFLLLVVIAVSPVVPGWLDPRLPDTHEHFRYLLLSDWFLDSLRAGNWYPRWLPEMNGGFGYPEFVFYQPGYFFVNAFASLFADDPLLRQLLALSAIALAGGLGVYRLARCFVAARHALLAVAVFQLAPYVHINLFVRGDLSEWMALELAAWPVYFLHRFVDAAAAGLARQRCMAWTGLCLSTAVVCYSHPVAVMFLPPLLLVLGGGSLIGSRAATGHRRTALLELCGAVFMGLALSAPYWMTVATMKHLVNTDAALGAYFETWNNTTPIQYLLFGSFLKGASFNDHEFLGAPFVLLSLAGCWYGRKIPLVRWAGLAYLAILFALTPWAKALWHVYPLKLLQFPWRLAVFAPVLQVVCMMGFKQMPLHAPRLRGALLLGGLGLLAAWSFAGHRGFQPFELVGPLGRAELSCLKSFAQSARPGSVVSTLDAGEWLPRTSLPGIASLSPREAPATSSACRPVQERLTAILAGKAPGVDFFPTAEPREWIEAAERDWQIDRGPRHTPFMLEYQLSGDATTAITINQLYLPGWVVTVNGNRLEREDIERGLRPDGRMQVALPPGTWRIQAWYDGPPGWRMRDWSLLVLSAMAAIYWTTRLRKA